MKARILAAILLMFTFATAYNQTSRRGERNNDNKNNQQTERKEQTREATQPERSVQTRNENSERRGTSAGTQDSQQTRRTSREQQQPQQQEQQTQVQPQQQPQQPAQTSRRGETRDQNRESNNRTETRESRREDNNSRRTETREDRRESERRVVVHEYNREPQRKVIVRDNRREERTYVRIDRPVRKVVVVNHPKHYRPVSVEYRRVHSPYREPRNIHVYWSVSLHNDFRVFYPEVRIWRYDIGYRLPVVPAYDADYYIGDVARVYGKVSDIYYEHGTDEYFLYFGDYFPYHDFSIVIPGREARAFSRRPERFFRRANLAVTGYITDYDDKPEIVVRRASQIELY